MLPRWRATCLYEDEKTIKYIKRKIKRIAWGKTNTGFCVGRESAFYDILHYLKRRK